VVIQYRHFGTTYRHNLERSRVRGGGGGRRRGKRGRRIGRGRRKGRIRRREEEEEEEGLLGDSLISRCYW
jgi:hypothetical protein